MSFRNFERFRGFFIALAYAITSTTITFFNKGVFVYGFNGPNTLTLGQIAFSLLFLQLLKRFQILPLPDFKKETAIKTIPLAVAFSLMVVSGLSALSMVNVPMFSALRRLSTLLVMIQQFYFLGKKVEPAEFFSVILMIFGAIIAAWGDLTFDIFGYTLTIINCFFTAWYLVLIATTQKATELDSFGLMYYNNLLSLPGVIIIVYFSEWDVIMSFTEWKDSAFLLCFIMSSLQAFLLNYTIFLCSTYNSPLVTSVTGQIKAVVQTIIGLFIFGAIPLTPPLLGGLVLGTVASFWYTQIKYEQQIRVEREKRSNKSSTV